MINVPSVQALNHELPGEPEILTHSQSFLVNVLSREIFCDAAIVCVGKLRCVDFIVEEVVNVDIVNVPLYRLQVNVLGFLLPSSTSRLSMIPATLNWVVILCGILSS